MRDLWVLDIEASGLSPISYPIEIGLVHQQHEYQTLIRPDDSWKHWNLDAEALHGLSREEISNNGESAEMVARALNQLLADQTVYSDHEDWDGFWMRRLFETVGIEQQFYVEDLYALLGKHKVSAYLASFDALSRAKDHRAHRALNDARVIHRAAVLALND